MKDTKKTSEKQSVPANKSGKTKLNSNIKKGYTPQKAKVRP